MAELSLLAKATIVLALTLVAGRVLHRARASVRALVLASAFGVLLVLPFAGAVMPARTVELPVSSMPAFLVVEEQVAEPSAATASPQDGIITPSAADRVQAPSLAAIVRLAWAVGAMLFLSPIVLALWRLRQLRLRGVPWLEGRALVADAAGQAGVVRPVAVFLHDTLAAPMTCGFLRPAIGLPIDATAWAEADLRHALVHELEHVRRRDWPVHLLARMTCALYWFHPLAWIAWRQLSLESERACDDAVLRGTEGTAYAEQLVSLARRLSKRSPVPMLSMAGRSDLSARVTAVLDGHLARGRAGAISASLIVIASMVLTAAISPLQAGPRASSAAGRQATTTAVTTALRFEVASIKRNTSGVPSRARLEPGGRFTATSVPLFQLITQAYGVLGFQVVSAPDWVTAERYDVLAKAPEGVSFTPQTPMPAFLRGLLADRFAFQAHLESRDMPIYELVLARNDRALGPKIARAAYDCSAPQAAGPPVAPGSPEAECALLGRLTAGNGRAYRMAGFPMSRFAEMLGGAVERKVVDKTGLSGSWTLDLEFTPDAQPDSPGNSPSIFTAVQEQLGLRLQPARGPVDALVIDRVEKPTPDDAVVPAARAEPQAAAATLQTPAAQAADVAFEVASIRPNRSGSTAASSNSGKGRLSVTNQTALALIAQAYGVRRDRLVGGPAWLDAERFDIAARAPENTPDNQIAPMLRSLLAERFKLSVRTEMRDQPVYALVLANRDGRLGPNLKASTECDAKAMSSGVGSPGLLPRIDQPSTQTPCGMRSISDGRGVFITAGARPLSDLARSLDGRADRFVIDRTGLTGTYNFELRFGRPDVQAVAGQDGDLPIVFTALQEQLGLKLESDRGPVEFLVIDRVERPTEN